MHLLEEARTRPSNAYIHAQHLVLCSSVASSFTLHQNFPVKLVFTFQICFAIGEEDSAALQEYEREDFESLTWCTHAHTACAPRKLEAEAQKVLLDGVRREVVLVKQNMVVCRPTH